MTALPCPPANRPAGAVSLLVDATLRVLAAEPGALALIQAHPGLIALRQARLYLPRQQSMLDATVAVLLAGTGGTSRGLALQRPAQAPLTLKLERQASQGPLAPSEIWLHLVDTAAPRLDGELLATMFGLTASELRVALMLAQGLSSEDMASRLGVQSNTVRGHIKQLLAKTQTRRQAQLVAWLWRSAAVVHPAHQPAAAAPPISGDERLPLLTPCPNG